MLFFPLFSLITVITPEPQNHEGEGGSRVQIRQKAEP